ncbi:15455_t:CDS:2, partial [Acaulospora morrowiae]
KLTNCHITPEIQTSKDTRFSHHIPKEFATHSGGNESHKLTMQLLGFLRSLKNIAIACIRGHAIGALERFFIFSGIPTDEEKITLLITPDHEDYERWENTSYELHGFTLHSGCAIQRYSHTKQIACHMPDHIFAENLVLSYGNRRYTMHQSLYYERTIVMYSIFENYFIGRIISKIFKRETSIEKARPHPDSLVNIPLNELRLASNFLVLLS